MRCPRTERDVRVAFPARRNLSAMDRLWFELCRAVHGVDHSHRGGLTCPDVFQDKDERRIRIRDQLNNL